MDLQGVGAVAAAVVAAASIPISTLVGRWQMRGAVQAAEATYKAAVDAAKNQALAAHAQWRRGVQRDAYAAFLLAAHQVRNVCDRIALDANTTPILSSDLQAELHSARSALQSTYAIAVLEGSDSVREAATALKVATLDFANAMQRTEAEHRAMGYLASRAEEEQRSEFRNGMAGGPLGPWTRANRAFLALTGVAATLRAGEEIPDGLREEISQEFQSAFDILPIEEAPRDLIRALQNIAHNQELSSAAAPGMAFATADQRFVAVAKFELENPI
ncbi:hypothetical protein [Streptomyces sp. NPDC052292]|uniref:hypothetical protein n=1 Tax=Streptomyces sp. NPDC052292 TaxID=3155053 RepID=UPI00343EB281